MLRHVLKRAWQITWRYRFLWLFGLFTMLLAGNGNEFNLLISGTESIEKGWQRVVGIEGTLESLRQGWSANSWLVIIISLIIFLFFLWLSIISQIGLIHCLKKINANQNSSLKEGFAAGKKYFWSVLGVNIIAIIIIFGLLLALGLPIISIFLSYKSIGWATFFTLVAFIILVPLAIVISLITRFASCYIVLKGQDVWQAFQKGIRLFGKHWLKSVELAFVLFLISLVVSFILTLLIALVNLPLAIPLVVLQGFFVPSLVWTTIILMVIVSLVILFTGGAVLTTFQYNTWTLFFIELTGSEPVQGGETRGEIKEKL